MSQTYTNQLFGVDLTHLTKDNRKELLDKITPKCHVYAGGTWAHNRPSSVYVESPKIEIPGNQLGGLTNPIAKRGELLSLSYEQGERSDMSITPVFDKPVESLSFYVYDNAMGSWFSSWLQRQRPIFYESCLEALSFDQLPEEIKKAFQPHDYVKGAREPLSLSPEEISIIVEMRRQYEAEYSLKIPRRRV